MYASNNFKLKNNMKMLKKLPEKDFKRITSEVPSDIIKLIPDRNPK